MTELNAYLLQLRNRVRLAHHIPGRIRLKFNSGLETQWANFKADSMSEQLSRFHALKSYEVHPASRSAILEYDPAIIDPQLLHRLFSEDMGDAESACHQLFHDVVAAHQI
ncbi:HMA2 domain-containing protein [Spongorhabdus nitratireducens]